jgi:hypothetical protein
MGDLRPKPDNKSVGERSQAIILARLSEVGYSVMIPFGENHRYDLVIEDGDGNFHRIQCKTGCISNGSIDFNTASNYYHHPRKGEKVDYRRKDYKGQIDFFAVYSPDTKKVYLVPVDHIPITEGRLRLEPTKNNQEKYVRWAKDYEL